MNKNLSRKRATHQNADHLDPIGLLFGSCPRMQKLSADYTAQDEPAVTPDCLLKA